MIYDCFPFYNEFDILEFRLQEMWDIVDRFVLVESTKTHANLPKPLFYAENKERFKDYADRITHIIVDDMPDTTDAMALDQFQRNCIVRGLGGLKDDDLVLISDVDEIIRKSVLKNVIQAPQDVFGFQMIMSNFKFNNICIEGESHSVWSMAVRGRHLLRLPPQYFRDLRFRLHGALNAGHLIQEFFQIIPHGGWHFSYLGNDDHVRNKIKNFAHQEFNTPDYINQIDVEAFIQSGRDIYNRPGYKWAPVAVNEYFPETLRNNLDKYARHIAQNPTIALQSP